MNKFTLEFDDHGQEIDYRNSIFQSQFIIAKRILILMLIGQVSAVFYGFFVGQYLFVVTILILCGLCIFMLIKAKTSIKILDYGVLLLQGCFGIALPVLLFKKILIFPDCNEYLTGYTVGFIQTSMLVGTQFKFKVLMIVFFFIGNLVSIIEEKLYIQPTNFAYIITLALLLAQLYQNEFHQRQTYLEQQKHLQMQSSFDAAQMVSVISCYYHSTNNQIRLKEINQVGKKMMKIEKQGQFLSFMRQSYIQGHVQISSNDGLIQLKQSFSDQKTNLEQFTYSLLTDYHKLLTIEEIETIKSIFGCYFCFDIQKRSKQYRIKVFRFFDSKYRAVLLIQRNNEELKLQTFKHQYKLYQKLLFKQNLELQDQMRNVIPFIKHINKYRLSLTNQALLNVRESFYMILNQAYNLYEFRGLDQYQGRIQQFNIMDLISHLSEIFKYRLHNKKIQFEIINNLRTNKVVSSQKCFLQIMLNLLDNCIKFGRKKNKIFIILESLQNEHLKKDIISISLIQNSKKISESIMYKLPILNPRTYYEMKRINKMKQVYLLIVQFLKLPLGIVVSTKLIGQLGPSKKLEIKQLEDGQCFTFQLYQDMTGVEISKIHRSTRLNLKNSLIIEQQQQNI